MDIAKFLRTPILKNICERLLLKRVVVHCDNDCIVAAHYADISFAKLVRHIILNSMVFNFDLQKVHTPGKCNSGKCKLIFCLVFSWKNPIIFCPHFGKLLSSFQKHWGFCFVENHFISSGHSQSILSRYKWNILAYSKFLELHHMSGKVELLNHRSLSCLYYTWCSWNISFFLHKNTYLWYPHLDFMHWL